MGERLTIGEMEKTTEEEHVARYEYVIDFTKGRSVIDAACGTGYGTAMIANRGAREVTGVDISEDAIATATSKYSHPAIKFMASNVEELANMGSDFADTVVSFETIEHVADDRAFLKAVHHVLKKGGTFIVSTPEKRCGGVKERLSGIPANPFHRREYARNEFVNLVGEFFTVDEILAQNRIPKILTFLPVTFLVKLGLRLMAMVGINRFRNLYLHGTGPAVVPDRLCRGGMPRFWIIRCHK